jgi:hypothetical protein
VAETSLSLVTRLAVHAADEDEEECDGSFHARLHRRLPLCGAVLSAPPHAAPPLTIGKREYLMRGALVLDASA